MSITHHPGRLTSSSGNITVADTTALTAYSLTGLSNGALAWVASVKDFYELNTGSSATVDTTDFTVVATSSGSGRWLRLGVPNIEWLATTTWYIDNSSGNNENSGAASNLALKTWSELARRVNGLLFQTSTVTVNLLTNLASTDQIIVNFDVCPTNSTAGTLNIVGTRTTSTTGSLTAVTNLSISANTPNSITSAAGFTSYVRRYIRFLNGSTFRCSAWIAKDTGGGSARISVATSENGGATGNQTNPVNGDNYEIYAFTTAPCLISKASPRTIVAAKNIDFTGSAVTVINHGSFMRLIGCSITPTGTSPSITSTGGSININNCLIAAGGTWTADIVNGITIRGGLIDGAINTTTFVQWAGRVSPIVSPMIQNASLYGSGLKITTTASLAIFDSPASETYSLQCLGGSIVTDLGLNSLWGSGNAPTTACILLNGNDNRIAIYDTLAITHSATYDVGMGNVVTYKMFADITNRCDFRDTFGNVFRGPGGGSPSAFGGLFATDAPAMYSAGEDLVPARIVRVSSSTVIKAQADTAAKSTYVLGVTTSQHTSGNNVLVVCSGFAVVKCDADPSEGALLYLSPTNAGQATSTVPAVSGTNQKLRLGTAVRAFGGGSGLAVVALDPELLPITSDGVAP